MERGHPTLDVLQLTVASEVCAGGIPSRTLGPQIASLVLVILLRDGLDFEQFRPPRQRRLGEREVGLGRGEICLRLAADGLRVVAADLEPAAQRLQDFQSATAGLDIAFEAVDVGDPASCEPTGKPGGKAWARLRQ